MIKLDKETASAIVRLVDNPDFKIIRSWIDLALKLQDRANRWTRGTDDIMKGQGRAQIIERIAFCFGITTDMERFMAEK